MDSTYLYKTKNDTVNVTYTFEQIPKCVPFPTSKSGLTNKAYVDSFHTTNLRVGNTVTLPCSSGATLNLISFLGTVTGTPVIFGGNIRFTIPDTAITLGAYITSATVIVSQTDGVTQSFTFSDDNDPTTNVISTTVPFFYSFVSNGAAISISARATTYRNLSSINVLGESSNGTHIFLLELL
jgi:hypothetical protein